MHCLAVVNTINAFTFVSLLNNILRDRFWDDVSLGDLLKEVLWTQDREAYFYSAE